MIRRTPDIYIIGAQKSGTTSLFDWLSQHPAIYSHPFAKDYPYFSNSQTHHEGSKRFHEMANGASPGQRILQGEANAIFSQLAPQRMKNAIPDARLIAILRNPAERFFSAYSYAVERLLEHRSLAEVVNDELNGFKYLPEDALQRDYLGHGYYAQQLRRLYCFFDKSQVKIIIFEQLKQNPIGIYQELCTFINVSSFIPQIKIKNQTKGGCRSKFLAKISHTHPPPGITRYLIRLTTPFLLRAYLRKIIISFNRVRQPKLEFHEHVRRKIDDHYKKEINDLKLLINQDIHEWK